MKSIFTKFSVRTIGATVAMIALAGVTAYQVLAVCSTVCEATGGSAISIDKTTAVGGSSSWTTLTGFVITESSLGDIGLGLHTITLPAGWEFKTDEAVIISGNSTDIDLNFTSITPGASTLSFNVRGQSTTNPAVLTFSNIKVRPTGTVPGSVNMTMTSGTIAGVDGTTNFGTLTSVPGTPTKLAFTTQPTDTVYGSNISTVVVKTQDQFGNNSVPTSGANNVTLSLNSGTGAIAGTLVLDIGSTGIASFSSILANQAGTGNVLRAVATGLTSSDSSSFVINKATPTAVLVVTNPSVAYNTLAQSATVGTTSSSVPGSVANISTGGAADQTTAGTYAVTADFVPTDTTNYNTITAQSAGNFVINKATPTATLVVTNPSVAYNTLAQSAIVGTTSSSVPGSIANISTGGAATQTNVGTYAVTADFVPTDTANYNSLLNQSAGNFDITKINQSALTLSGPATATYGTTPTLTTSGGSGTGSVSFSVGTSTGCSVSGSILTVVSVGGSCDVTATKAADTNYNVANSVATAVTLVKATPTVTLAVNNSPVTYDTTAKSASVTISASSVPGSVANISTGGAADQTTAGTYAVTANFVPTDTINYNTITAQSSGDFVINKATPVITWANPSGIVYGTALSATQLNASTPVAGSFVYTPAVGALLNAGNGQTLSTDFTPTDTTNYNSVNGTTATINVAKATPTITWATPSSIVAGTLLSGTQLNASANAIYNSVNAPVSGTFTYTPVSGTQVTLAGTSTLSTNFTPTDTANYNSVNGTTVVLTTVPAPISQIELAASPTSLDITSASTLTVTGKDQYGNVVTNNSTTPVILSVDNGALATTRLTLTSGVKTTTLSRSSAGASIVNAFTVLSGSLASAEATVTFTDGSDRTAPVISSITTNKASYEATNDTNITVTVVEDNTANTVTVNGFAAVETGTPGTWTVTFVKSTTIGTQSLTVSATDASLNVRTSNSSYNVVANSVSAVTPTVAINGAAILPVYTATAAAARFASGLQFNATNTASVTVNGVTKTPGSLITADSVASSTTLGVHTYDVIVTSSTGHTANVLVSYQVNADAVTPVTPTVVASGTPVQSVYSLSQAQTRFASGAQFTTTNAVSATVNGVTTSIVGGVVTADTVASSTTLGVHTYNVVVTSSTGHTANVTISYQVNANSVTPVIPTVSLTGVAASSSYTLTQAQARFTLANGIQFTTTNAATTTVNGVVVTSGTTVNADSQANATTLGAHSYNVIVTSTTGHTANVTVTYQVNTDAVTPVIPTVSVTGTAITSAYTATAAAARFTLANGLQFTTTNAASVTVNGATVTPGATVNAVSQANAVTLGAHSYDVIVTSTTGHTANILVTYQVNADAVTPVTPTATLSGAAVLTTYTVSEANTRFPSGVQLTTTNAATTTVNGVVVTSAGTLTVANNAAAKTLGAHVYNVIVTSTTGHTANITVAYEVTADPAVQGNGTLGVTGITASSSFATADGTFTNGWSWVFYVTVPTTETSLQMKFADWVSGSNSIAAANNIRIYSPQSLTASTTSTAKTVTAANTYTSAMTLTSDLDANTEGRQVKVIVEAAVPVSSVAGSYSTSYGTKSQ